MKRNKRVAYLLIGMVLALCLVLASCSSPGQTPSATSPPKTTSVAPTSVAPTSVAPTSVAPIVSPSSAPTSATAKPSTAATSSAPQAGGILTIMTSSPPIFATVADIPAPAATYLLPVLEPLVGYSKDGPVPTKLATSWELGADGKSLIFKLRKGVKFQDGTDFNATAAKFNLDKELGVRSEMISVKSVDVVDDYTVKLNLNNYSSTLIQQLGYVAGMMQSPAALQAHDKAWFSTHAVGAGPFELVSFNAPTSLSFKKFSGYWDTGKPYVDELRYTFVVDPVTAELSFRAGDVLIWDQLLPANLKSIANMNLNMNVIPKTVWVAIGDSANPNSPFAKIQVRQALDYAIDKASVVKTFGYNTWESPNQVVSSKQPGYIPNFQGRNYDPAKAKQLLAEAGYANGFKTKMTVRNNLDMNVMGTYQAFLKAVGIDAELVPADTGTYRSLLTKGWEGIILNGLGISGTAAKMLELDGPNANWTVSASITDKYKNALAKAIAADKATELKANQDLVQTVFDDAVLVPWNIDSISCVYGNSVHTDMDTINLQIWNPGDTWISKNK
jgi:peptide/nickel transport system substrate-binding protein